MLNLKFHPFLMLRTPAYSAENYGEEAVYKSLQDPLFRSALRLASSSLYRVLEKRGFEFDALDDRAKLSVRKYFNRMCYRPTPFGLFSSFSPLSWKQADNVITLTGQGQGFLTTDFSTAVDLIAEVPVSLEQTSLYSNKTIYQVGRSLRYLVRKPKEVFGLEHGIQSVGSDTFLKDLLRLCASGQTGAAVKEYLLNYFEDEVAAQGYLIQLVEAQLLTTELLPNIVGDHYSKRILSNRDTLFSGSVPENLQLTSQLGVSPECSLPPGNDLYCVYEKGISGGGLQEQYQDTILDGLHCLHRLTSAEQPYLLTAFKNRFFSKFENQEIPLLRALDPEAGVGYGQMEHLVADDQLCSGINADGEPRNPSVTWGPVQQMLVSKWTAGFDRRPTDPIIIAKEDLACLPDSAISCPPGINVVFRIAGSGRVLIEQAGGVTGTALHGRFTPYNETVLSHTRNIAETEQRRNKHAIFAEVGYFNNEHAANINVREHLFDYEIPILTQSTLPFENQIQLNDLLVSVIDDQIVLRSWRLNKVIIPRLSSAYNYNRSELSVFRFLCDLQHQGVKSTCHLDMKRLFPNLPFYPRIEHEDCILSPATWVLERKEIEAAVTSTGDFLQLATSRNLPRFIALTRNDHQLVFDLEFEQEVEFLRQCIRTSSTVELVEFFASEKVVMDDTGKYFESQFVASLYNEQEVYPEKGRILREHKRTKLKRAFVPGDEWVYLKVYCHEGFTDEILSRYVYPVIKCLLREEAVAQWFFIRYKDRESHLRIRVRRRKGSMSDILDRFNCKLYPLLRRGSVSSIVADTYIREVERYGPEVMEDVEAFFEASSNFVIRSLKSRAPGPEGRLKEAVQVSDLILSTFFQLPECISSLLKGICDSMKLEYARDQELKVKLDSKFRQHRLLIEKSLSSQGLAKTDLEKLKTALDAIKNKCVQWPLDRQYRLAGNLLHMHINRVFMTEQRKHEFIICYLLHKHYKSVGHRSIYGLCESSLQQSAS